MKIVKAASVKSDGTDILYSGIILNEASKDKAIEICNNYINSLHMKDSLPSEVQAYDLMHCTTQFIGCDVSKLKNEHIGAIHSDAICYVDKIGIYYTFEDGKLFPQNIGLHVDIYTSNIPSKYFTKRENSHITVALCNSKASAKNTDKCFQNINNGTEFSKCTNIDPVFMSGKFEFVNTKHAVIDELPDDGTLFKMICDAVIDKYPLEKKYEQSVTTLFTYDVDSHTILILCNKGIRTISDLVSVIEGNPYEIKSAKGIAAKRYAKLITALNRFIGAEYSAKF